MSRNSSFSSICGTLFYYCQSDGFRDILATLELIDIERVGAWNFESDGFERARPLPLCPEGKAIVSFQRKWRVISISFHDVDVNGSLMVCNDFSLGIESSDCHRKGYTSGDRFRCCDTECRKRTYRLHRGRARCFRSGS